MDLRISTGHGTAHSREPVQAVLAEATCSWYDEANAAKQVTAVVVHAGRDMLVLEASDPRQALPPLGTSIQVTGEVEHLTGRLAGTGVGGRFLISLGNRPVRGALRLRVSVPGTLRSATLSEPATVEIVDLTTSGARIRGVELPAGSQVTFEFIPPGKDEPVTVRALVAHATTQSSQPWIGVAFRLVAMRGGRAAP
ncbi:MAG: PilZ domain-containing protein [Chloroflexota bacterium]|nr:PilZ domain-containing protein [Chloroflexota bacterium]